MGPWLLALAVIGLGYAYVYKTGQGTTSPVNSGSLPPTALVPTGANVTFADGSVQTLDADESVASLKNQGAVSYMFGGITRAL